MLIVFKKIFKSETIFHVWVNGPFMNSAGQKSCFYLHCILVFFQFMKTKRLAFKNKICNVTCMYYQHGDFVKAGQTQSEVLKIHAETTPLLMANGCYSFFHRLYQKVSHLIFLPFYFIYLFYSEPPTCLCLPYHPFTSACIFITLFCFWYLQSLDLWRLFMAIRRGHVRYLKVSRICVQQGLNVDFKPFISRYTESVS